MRLLKLLLCACMLGNLLMGAAWAESGTKFSVGNPRPVAYAISLGTCDDHATDQSSFVTFSANCGTAETSTSQHGHVIPASGYLVEFACTAFAAPGAGTTWSFVPRVNYTTSLTAVTCSFTNPATTCAWSGAIAVTRGHMLTIEFNETGVAYDGQFVACTAMFTAN